MTVIKLSSHRMRDRGISGIPNALAVYSWDGHGDHKGMYLVTDEQAGEIIARRYVGASKPSVVRRNLGELMMCWGAEPTEGQREWLRGQGEGKNA